MWTHARRAAAAVALALILGACGAQPQEPPSVNLPPEKANRFFRVALADRDVSLAYPRSWLQTPGKPPQVVTITSGTASLAVFAYPAVSVVIDDSTQKAAEERLLASLKRRDPALEITDTTRAEVDGAPALEIRGLEVRGGRRIGVRSVHVYKGAGEYVIDALADRDVFNRTDRDVFDPVIDRIRFGGDPPGA
ncbi:MAG: hypothetical protein EXQ70_07055 [Solirubrobacterales bacterium]|nr:hypothetical protein [Solirubrobacterales bacterium]